MYGEAFYKNRREVTVETAQLVLSLLRAHYQFSNVVDVGCGTGTWLLIAKSNGASHVEGFEGPWLSDDLVDDSDIKIHRVDLEAKLPPFKADLAICLEVAEHLSPQAADKLIQALCSGAPCVLFSAAIPGQGGVGHINEQWQSVWAKKFVDNGYRPHDFIRPTIWDIKHIPVWYRQNIIVYANKELSASLPSPAPILPLDVVHPSLFETTVLRARNPSLRTRIKLAKTIPQLFAMSAFRRLSTREPRRKK